MNIRQRPSTPRSSRFASGRGLWAPSLILAGTLAACTSSTDEDAGVVDVGSPDDAGVIETPDAGFPDAGEVPAVCRELGLAPQAFKEGAATYQFGDVAGDFTITELDGTAWNLREQWTGCESYTFVSYISTNATFEEDLWGTSPEPLIDTALNAHFFFLSWERTEGFRRARVEDVKTRLDLLIDSRFSTQEERDAQRRRFHYATDSIFDIQGSLGAFFVDYMNYQADPTSLVDLGERGQAPPPLPFALAIDRDQKWDAGENLSQYVGGPPAFSMASYLPMFFDHKARIRDAQATESGIEKIVMLDERVTDRIFDNDFTLPDAARMATFDTLEFDVTVNCPHRNVFGCSEWDRIAQIDVCLDSMCMERRELVRWITPYWRRGERRWVMDASALIGLLASGGTQRFHIEMGPSWERPTERDVRIVMRLSTRGGVRATGGVRAFTGGDFNADYNTRDPFMFTPPATATRVELVVMVSGHGQADRTNCSEWCDHRHQFALNNQNLEEVRHTGNIGSTAGCGPAAARGAPPGQWGNWAPERAFWCPGLPVDHIRIDLTGQVMLGQENTLTYSANYRGGAPGGGNIDLTSYVVWFE